jgi:hypothetical protein
MHQLNAISPYCKVVFTQVRKHLMLSLSPAMVIWKDWKGFLLKSHRSAKSLDPNCVWTNPKLTRRSDFAVFLRPHLKLNSMIFYMLPCGPRVCCSWRVCIFHQKCTSTLFQILRTFHAKQHFDFRILNNQRWVTSIYWI